MKVTANVSAMTLTGVSPRVRSSVDATDVKDNLTNAECNELAAILRSWPQPAERKRQDHAFGSELIAIIAGRADATALFVP